MDEGGGLENRCGASHRGFESYSHRHYTKIWRGAGVVELGCLLSSYGLTAIVGSNPTSSASYYAPVAQWIRASDYGSEGRGFESSRALNNMRFRSRGSGCGAESANMG